MNQTQDPWKIYTELDFQDTTQMRYHLDTRDFCGWSSDKIVEKEELETPEKIFKNPSWYIHTGEEIKTLLDRLYNESGGKVGWRYLSLSGTGVHRTQGWQMKYITIYRDPAPDTEDRLIVTANKFIFPKSMLAEPVNMEFLHAH